METQPVFKKRIGAVSASLFNNEVEGANGPFISQSIALQISFAKEGNWKQNSLTILRRNLVNTIKVLQETESHLNNEDLSAAPVEEVLGQETNQ